HHQAVPAGRADGADPGGEASGGEEDRRAGGGGRRDPAPPPRAPSLRRAGKKTAELVGELGETRLDHGARHAFVGGEHVALSRKEFELLSMLVQAQGEAVTREALMEGIWDTSWIGASRTLDVHVSSLRAKLGRAGLIETVRGVGYRVAVPVRG